jgi:dTDP-4-dehydrorhamnose reductase
MTGRPVSVLVIGKTGQLAGELARAQWPAGWRVSYADRQTIDLSRPEDAARAVDTAAPDLVINAAAHTAVDKAESEAELAHAVNALAPAAVAKVCAQRGIPFITVSTDYVFDGSKTGPYREDDPVGPTGVYGRSKEEGERLVREAGPRHLILRTSWVFSALGNNFVRTMLRLGGQRPELRVVADQRGKPTSAADLARAIIAAAEAILRDDGPYGTYHLSNAGPTSWHQFALAIFAGAAKRGAPVPRKVEAIPASEYPTPAKRPANSELACEKFEQAFGHRFRPWSQALDDVLDELIPAARQ